METTESVERKSQLGTKHEHDYTVCDLDIAEEYTSYTVEPV